MDTIPIGVNLEAGPPGLGALTPAQLDVPCNAAYGVVGSRAKDPSWVPEGREQGTAGA